VGEIAKPTTSPTQPKSPKPKKSLNIRERKFVKALVEGKTQTQAMREAGYKESMALSRSTDKLVETRKTIQALMEQRGLDDDCLINKLLEGLESERPFVVDHDIHYTPDMPTRHRYLTTSLQLKGHLRESSPVTNVTIDNRVVYVPPKDNEDSWRKLVQQDNQTNQR
jgi:hypothetical protein